MGAERFDEMDRLVCFLFGEAQTLAKYGPFLHRTSGKREIVCVSSGLISSGLQIQLGRYEMIQTTFDWL